MVPATEPEPIDGMAAADEVATATSDVVISGGVVDWDPAAPPQTVDCRPSKTDGEKYATTSLVCMEATESATLSPCWR